MKLENQWKLQIWMLLILLEAWTFGSQVLACEVTTSIVVNAKIVELYLVFGFFKTVKDICQILLFFPKLKGQWENF